MKFKLTCPKCGMTLIVFDKKERICQECNVKFDRKESVNSTSIGIHFD